MGGRFFAVIFGLVPCFAFADVTVRNCTVVVQTGASEEVRHAAQELRDHLQLITGAQISLLSGVASAPANSIVVGPGPIAKQLLPDAPWASLKPEQTLVRSVGNRLIVAGGAPRGTLYAVYRLLQEKAGVRWWAPWATTIPHNSSLSFGEINWSETPAFEYRDPYWFHAFDADWAARNFNNGWNTRVDEARGGKTQYEGFVHTYDGLVPPDKIFPVHPEWFSLINGTRTATNSQLCTTNPELRDYVVAQVRKKLRANPKATIISVSQNDCFNPCQCPVCRALAEREGSDAALVLDLANYVGDKIRAEFPNVAVDTLAYQWSRHPTRNMRPRPNVIVRLCSIECNFAQPLYAQANQAFADDIRGWSRLTQRLYVWDYCTNFAHYLQPQPDYFSVGKSIKWFADNGVKGVFEEGAYQSTGADMAELKSWVIAQMLWDPKQDPDKLVDEFLRGYYGPAAAPIKQYLTLMATEAQGTNVTFALGSSPAFLNYGVMSKAAQLWTEARRLTSGSPQLSARVQMSALSPEWVWLTHWRDFRYDAAKPGTPWPMTPTRQDLADRWIATTQGLPGVPGYTPVIALDEGMASPQQFIAGLGPEPSIPKVRALPARPANPAPPTGLPAGVDFQDDLANLWQVPDNSELRPDRLASDGIACWMPGTHHEWAFQMPLSKKAVSGRFKIYVVARVEQEAYDGAAFSAGVYDNRIAKDLNTSVFKAADMGPGYQTFELGTFDVHPGLTVWVAPPSNPAIRAVWVDRVYLVRVP